MGSTVRVMDNGGVPLSPELPEPELTRHERRAERKRLKLVRRERRRTSATRKKGTKGRAKGKDRKKGR